MVSFNDIKWDSHKKQFYYDDDDVARTHVPVNYEDQRGNFSLSKAQLDKWFSIDKRSKLSLPKYIITNEMEYGNKEQNQYWRLNGGIAVYEPIEWVPCVHLIKQFPASMLEKEITITESETQQTELWAEASASLSMSASASYFGVQVAAEAKVEGGVKTKKETSRIMEVKEHGKIPPGTPCYEVMVGMILKLKKTHSFNLRPDDVYWTQNDNRKLTWGGDESWGSIQVLDYSLQRKEVKALQFYYQSTFIQTLPVLQNQKLHGMHILFSCVGWKEWYAYTRAENKDERGQIRLQAYPAWDPMSTLLTLE
ncbi:hypothetical protein LOZ52_001154 [Ophidiomyces ophidiicola]|uniref:uncharacterized protein n=1 Tax=Ophidiomyces ophidiicola TaxID=1387563 RepID=UPI0020C3DEE8|nr:uncharacterized protein LOZ57_000299 [Ophidiomyces ophidiicola]KAI1923000.1 hypothetical protein LOZ64_001087 [Ophidiomyces ophidiicola]KAI1953957.1 hypothetical protein LOZ57_000299 [Ophidiomyces ophidiicola]KAI2014071.1 hypothetical protein LOZ49_001589 [Ophidiomyces ophidiicola]KAI2025724.1 hypothetical protein LOZ46_000658 [Ophidiomyces ophidiicola]KAI2059680.1 hypothetical protein LOZ44_000363 [Ophidiomyces ophidiicola]